MALVFVEKRPRPDDDRFSWEPFPDSDQFSADWWWLRQFDPDDPYVLFEVCLGDVPVARVELEPGVTIDWAYAAPQFASPPVEIGFFEVARSHRRRGIGANVVGGLTARYPGRRLLAFSEEADEFWASLGWDRYGHPAGPAHRTLFVQPGR